MREQIDTACPVLALATQYEALARQYSVASDWEVQDLGARMNDLAEAASLLSPSTREGAAFLIMSVSAEIDTIPSEIDAQVRTSKLMAQRLAYRSLDALRDETAKFPYARDFMMPAELDPGKLQEQ